MLETKDGRRPYESDYEGGFLTGYEEGTVMGWVEAIINYIRKGPSEAAVFDGNEYFREILETTRKNPGTKASVLAKRIIAESEYFYG